MRKTLVKLTFALALTGAAFSFGVQPAEATHHCGGGICPTVYDPVICNNGVVYSNKCFAQADCANGCRPYLPEA